MTEVESFPQKSRKFASPSLKLATERLSLLLAVSESANVPPVVFAFDALVRTYARGITDYAPSWPLPAAMYWIHAEARAIPAAVVPDGIASICGRPACSYAMILVIAARN